MIHQEHKLSYCQIFWGNVHWNEYTSAHVCLFPLDVFHYFLKLSAFEIFLFFENTSNFSLNNLLHCIQTCYILKCHKFLRVENFVVSRFFNKLVKFNSREIYWRQSNVKINSAIILVLKNSLHTLFEHNILFCSKIRHITPYEIHLVLISWCFRCFVVRMITTWLFEIKPLHEKCFCYFTFPMRTKSLVQCL